MLKNEFLDFLLQRYRRSNGETLSLKSARDACSRCGRFEKIVNQDIDQFLDSKNVKTADKLSVLTEVQKHIAALPPKSRRDVIRAIELYLVFKRTATREPTEQIHIAY